VSGAVNAIYLADESEKEVPATIWLQSISAKPGTTIRMLGVREPLTWEPNGKGVIIHVPPGVCKAPPSAHAWAFTVEQPQL
jgi:alpha-L-fucosidase